MDAKFSHLSDDLHVEISAVAPPAEAHARVAYALAEIRKFLIPDSNDDISMEQLREMENYMEPSSQSTDGEPPQKRPLLRPTRGTFRGDILCLILSKQFLTSVLTTIFYSSGGPPNRGLSRGPAPSSFPARPNKPEDPYYSNPYYGLVLFIS